MVNVEQLKAVDACLVQSFEVFGGDFITSFDIDAARFLVDQIIRGITAKDFFRGDQQVSQAILYSLIGRARSDLCTCWEYNFAGLGIDNVKHRF